MKSSVPQKFRTLDVRPILAEGGHPLEEITRAIDALAPGEGLALTAPFLPSPLIARLQSAGFRARPERRADGAWQTFFWRD
jgi:uncharacterized protein (DUF2249 family)